MNLANIRKKVMAEIGKKHHFRYRGVRNQIEEFAGIIINCYTSIFIIELEDNSIRSFSYNDFIINNIKILS